MRRAARVDANQAAIVKALRKAGVSVLDLSMLGDGCPDLLCATTQRQELIEVKRPKSPGRPQGTLTDDQIAFMQDWPRPVYVVMTIEEALRAMGL